MPEKICVINLYHYLLNLSNNYVYCKLLSVLVVLFFWIESIVNLYGKIFWECIVGCSLAPMSKNFLTHPSPSLYSFFYFAVNGRGMKTSSHIKLPSAISFINIHIFKLINYKGAATHFLLKLETNLDFSIWLISDGSCSIAHLKQAASILRIFEHFISLLNIKSLVLK